MLIRIQLVFVLSSWHTVGKLEVYLNELISPIFKNQTQNPSLNPIFSSNVILHFSSFQQKPSGELFVLSASTSSLAFFLGQLHAGFHPTTPQKPLCQGHSVFHIISFLFVKTFSLLGFHDSHASVCFIFFFFLSLLLAAFSHLPFCQFLILSPTSYCYVSPLEL